MTKNKQIRRPNTRRTNRLVVLVLFMAGSGLQVQAQVISQSPEHMQQKPMLQNQRPSIDLATLEQQLVSNPPAGFPAKVTRQANFHQEKEESRENDKALVAGAHNSQPQAVPKVPTAPSIIEEVLMPRTREELALYAKLQEQNATQKQINQALKKKRQLSN